MKEKRVFWVFFKQDISHTKKESLETSNVLFYQNALRRVITFCRAADTKRGEAVIF